MFNNLVILTLHYTTLHLGFKVWFWVLERHFSVQLQRRWPSCPDPLMFENSRAEGLFYRQVRCGLDLLSIRMIGNFIFIFVLRSIIHIALFPYVEGPKRTAQFSRAHPRCTSTLLQGKPRWERIKSVRNDMSSSALLFYIPQKRLTVHSKISNCACCQLDVKVKALSTGISYHHLSSLRWYSWLHSPLAVRS